MILYIYIYINISTYFITPRTRVFYFSSSHTLSFVNQIYRVVNYTHTRARTHLAYPKKPDFDWNDYDFTCLTNAARARALSNYMRVPLNTDYGPL